MASIIDSLITSQRPCKRRRTSEPLSPVEQDRLATPPSNDLDTDFRLSSPALEPVDDLLTRATRVLAIESAAISHITNLYQTDADARSNLRAAVHAVLQAQRSGGKLIACGVGKSAYIAMKFVATCKSLGVAASFMHACEAMHGDLGDIRNVSLITKELVICCRKYTDW